MAETGETPRELIFCHACENEWHRDEHGLQCPECNSDIVEVIDANSDPRDNHVDLTTTEDDEQPPQNPLHLHNPWQHEVGDPAEEDIDHVAFSPAPGVHFERTFFRSTSPRAVGSGPPNGNDIVAPIFQSLSALFEGTAASDGRSSRLRMQRADPQLGLLNPFQSHLQSHHQHHGLHPHHGTYTAGGRRDSTNTAQTTQADSSAPPLNNLHAVLATMLSSMQNSIGGNNSATSVSDGNPFHVFAQLLNPANAAHGDAVYTEEALDRIISQMMEQNQGGSAPGPASAAAIAALPTKQVDKSMMDQEGKAECSVCMDSVTVGDEVTVLPCKHWFHETCVGAWLKEHDTCPHCRQGITPRDGSADSPRSTEQAPRHSQDALGMPPGPILSSLRSQTPGVLNQPGNSQPYVPGSYPTYPESSNLVQPPHFSQPTVLPHSYRPPIPVSPDRRQTQRRRSSASVRGITGSAPSNDDGSPASTGVRGWFRSMRGGSGSSSRSP